MVQGLEEQAKDDLEQLVQKNDDKIGWLPNPKPKSKEELAKEEEEFKKNEGWTLTLNTGKDNQPLTIIGNSAYACFLMRDKYTPIFATLVWAFQIFILMIFMSDFMWQLQEDEDDTAAILNKSFDRAKAGKVGAAFFIAIRALPGVFKGIELTVVGIQQKNPSENPVAQCHYWKLIIVGIFELTVSLTTIAVGILASVNANKVCTSITASVVATFIQAIDEQAYQLIQYFLTPKYFQLMRDQLIIDYGRAKPLIMPEIRKLRSTVL